MKKTGKQLILISFLLAFLASGAVYAYLHSLKAVNVPKAVVKKISVWVAAEAIPPRTKITAKMLKKVQVSDDSVFGNYIKDTSLIIGKYTKESISKDQCFNTDMLFSSGGDEFASEIPEDHRAISLNVTGDSAVSYLIKPGDFVDILVYLPQEKDGSKLIRAEQAKLILQDIEVLAVDSQVDNSNKSSDAKLPNTFLVTLSVKTNDMEKLVLAQNIGTLKLALRPIDKESVINTSGTTDDGLLKNDTSGGSASGTAASYTVKYGDTLKSISAEFYGTPDKYTVIRDANNIQDEDMIVPGEVLKIPPKTE